MERATDFEGAVIQLNDSIHILERVALSDKDEGMKILEFLMSFNPTLCNQDDLSVKVGIWKNLNDECKPHARLIVEQSIFFEIPIWKNYKSKIQKIIDKRREIFSDQNRLP